MKRNILLVDDSKSTLILLKEIIHNSFNGFNVFKAFDGKEALDIFNKENIDIIISDINMPKMNGLTLLKKVRKIDKYVKFIVMSSSISSENFLEMSKLGYESVFSKPITYELVKIVIENAIDSIDRRNNLISSNKLLSEYKNAIDDSTIVTKTDLDGTITYVNDAFCEISGYHKDELIGKSHNIVRNSSVSNDFFKELWETISSGNIWKGKVSNRKKDGSIYFVSATISPIFDKNGQIEEYIAIRHDITNEVNFRKHLSNKIESQKSYITELANEMLETQQEMIFTLVQVAETRSQETGNHVRRVSEYSFLLANLYGLPEEECNILRISSPMHDIGKVGIPDAILNKAGQLTKPEFKFMQEHAVIGYEMLNKSYRPLMKASSIIAYEHHEKWNGTGYPRGIKSEDIHIYARITAVADVFDALSHDRIYKKAWPIEEVLEFFKEESGKHFDPKLIDLFFDNLEKFLEIKSKFDNMDS